MNPVTSSSKAKKAYESPVITKLHTSKLNKFGTSTISNRHVKTHIDGVTIEKLVNEYGSPLFVYSEKTLRKKYRQHYNAFSTRYPHVIFGWSYKTNYLKSICSIMHQEGAIAEIVSYMEYQKAKALGIPGDRIIFNGPHKSLEVLEEVIRDGVTVNVDHLDEIQDLERLAEKLGRKIKVGLRMNLDAGIYPQWQRFGFNLESGQAMDAVRMISREGLLTLAGLHCHIGTYILDPQAYARQIEKMLRFGYEVEDRFGTRIEYLDIGGGFPSKSKLKGTYLSADVAVPVVDEYAEAISDALHAHLRPGHQPKLILESGRALVDEAGSLITSIVASKRLPDGTKAYVADAGINLLYTAFWYQFNIETDREVYGLNEASVIYGPMCMNIDVINDYVQLPPLQRGQRLIISPVGAYNNTQWLQFIEYRPNCVLITEDGKVEVIREKEDLSDLETREKLPEKLKKINYDKLPKLL